MEKILDKKFFSSVVKDDKLNIAEKGGMLFLGGIIKGFVEPAMTGMKILKDKTGIDIEKKMVENQKKDEELREKNPTKWAAKKLAKGTVKGILAGTLGINLFGGDSSK